MILLWSNDEKERPFHVQNIQLGVSTAISWLEPNIEDPKFDENTDIQGRFSMISIIESTGNFFSKTIIGFSCVSLCDMETLLFSLSISVITQFISSPILNIFLQTDFS